MEQIIYQESLNEFINHCLVFQNIAEKIKFGMINAGYTNVMPNWVTSWKNSLPEIAKALNGSCKFVNDVRPKTDRKSK